MVGGSQSSKQRGLNVLIENLSFFIILYYKKWHSCVKRKIAISNVFSLKRTTSEKSRRQWTLHSFWGRPIASFFSELTITYHAVSGFLCFLVWEKNAILWKKGYNIAFIDYFMIRPNVTWNDISCFHTVQYTCRRYLSYN